MKKHSDKESELLDAINDCNVWRLTTTESLDELKRRGFHISERTLRRKKELLDEHDKKRPENLAAKEYAVFAVRAINSLGVAEKELWKIERETKIDWVKIGAIDKIIKIPDKIDGFYNLGPVVAELSKKWEKKKDDAGKGHS